MPEPTERDLGIEQEQDRVINLLARYWIRTTDEIRRDVIEEVVAVLGYDLESFRTSCVAAYDAASASEQFKYVQVDEPPIEDRSW